MQKCYSTDDETFSKDFPDDLEVGQVYYEANCIDIKAESYIHVNSILEQIDEWIYEDIGECYNNDFYNVPKEDKDELQKLIEQWANKHVILQYFLIKGKSVEKIATKDDV